MSSTFQAGQHYIATFPAQKKLNLFLPDYRIIRLVQLSSKVMPAFACFTFLWTQYISTIEQDSFVSTIMTAMFALSIPFQGVFWLGRRAKSPLPLSLLEWYESLRLKLINADKHIADQLIPTYQHFADLLKLAEKTWGQAYFDEL